MDVSPVACARTFDHVNWDSTDTFILCLGVLLLCVPTPTFNWRSFLYAVPVLTVPYFIGCTGVVSMTVISRWTCMYSCWNYVVGKGTESRRGARLMSDLSESVLGVDYLFPQTMGLRTDRDAKSTVQRRRH